MSKPHLVACRSCARHVRTNETACPFCRAVLADSLRESTPPRAPGVRLTRAALFAFGTGALALAPGCSSNSSAPDVGRVIVPPDGRAPIPDAGADDGPDFVIMAAYGGPPTGGGAPEDAGSDGGGADAANVGLDAASADDSAGEPREGAAPTDAAEDHVSIAPLYGIAAH